MINSVFTSFQRKIFIAGILICFLPKLINSYFLMPFPGSMEVETMQWSYYLDKWADYFFYFGVVIVVWGCFMIFYKGRSLHKVGSLFLLLLVSVFYYYTMFEFSAREMFKEPVEVNFKKGSVNDYAPDAYVLGVVEGNVAKAYPLKYLAYHHKIHDRLNNKDILVTYCSMCRSARIFSPMVNGEKVSFRLVGARHYNAILEDSKTKTWWYQATGEAAAGPLKGHKLIEIPSEQTTWKTWFEKFPNTQILKPDAYSIAKYDDWFEGFDKMRSPVDTISGNKKVWVVGVVVDQQSKSFTFPELIKVRVINTSIGKTPIAITIASDSLSTMVWNREVENEVIELQMDSTWTFMLDKKTNSKWNLSGFCISGFYIGKQLKAIQHYNEYLRSWEFFH